MDFVLTIQILPQKFRLCYHLQEINMYYNNRYRKRRDEIKKMQMFIYD